jgi:hypothetical protein
MEIRKQQPAAKKRLRPPWALTPPVIRGTSARSAGGSIVL